MNKTTEAFNEKLGQFIGSDQLYRDGFTKCIYSEGVQYIMENNMSWMVTDAMVLLKHIPKLKAEEFVVCKFTKTEDGGGIMIYEDGNDNHLHRQVYTAVDAIPDTLQMWYENETLYLPNER